MATGPALRRSPLKFFALVAALSIPFWLVGAAFENGLPLPINLPVAALMFVCPLAAALILVYREDGVRGIRRLLARVFDRNGIKNKLWYIPILLLVPLIYLLSYGVMRMAGRQVPDPDISLLSVAIYFVVFFITAVCEEAGWMGYAIEPLQDRWNALGAAIILGLVWASWHALPNLQAHHALPWIAGQWFYTVGLRVLIVWVYNNTGKSILAAVLMHAMDNVSAFSFPNNGSHNDPVIVGAITAVAVLAVTLLWGPKTLAEFRFGSKRAALETSV